jgi:hypothetical protein
MRLNTHYAYICGVAKIEPEVVEPEVVDDEENVFDRLDPESQKQLLAIQLEFEHWTLVGNRAIFERGRLLDKAKNILPHGAFRPWIKQTFRSSLPYSTAASYHRIFKMFENRTEMVERLPLHLIQQMSQERFPGELLKLIQDNPETFDEQAARQVCEAYQAHKKGAIKYREFEALTKSLIDLGVQKLEGENLARKSVLAKRTIGVGIYSLKLTIRRMRSQTKKILDLFPQAWESEAKKEALRELCEKDNIKQIDDAIQELEALKTLIIEGPQGPLFREKLAVKNSVVVMAEELGQEPNTLESTTEEPKLLT